MSTHRSFPKQPSSKTFYLGGAVLLFITSVSVFVLYNVLTGKAVDRPVVDGEEGVLVEPPAVSTVSVKRWLDGMAVSSTELAFLRPRAVMIDNQVDARPQAGLDQANVVFEAPVEGGITRYLAVFDPSVAVEKIGPVRSARPYFVDWAEGLRASYVHVGGSPEALAKLARLPQAQVQNVDEMATGWAFWRDANRIAPHQVLTSQEKLASLMGTSTRAERNGTGWRFESASGTIASAPDIRVAYGGNYNVRWRFVPAEQRYERIQAGANSPKGIKADNVIILKAEARVLDDKGRLEVKTVGSGDAILYRRGARINARWRRAGGELPVLVGTDGADIPLAPGVTWVQVVTDDLLLVNAESGK